MINHNSLIVLSFLSHSFFAQAEIKIFHSSSQAPASTPVLSRLTKWRACSQAGPGGWLKSDDYTCYGIGICIDHNKVLRRPRHPLRSVEEVAVTVFATFGARIVFWQIKLDYESSLLTTFNNPLGGTDSSACRLALLLHRRVSRAQWKSCLLGIPMRSLWIACKPATWTSCRHH